jgi:hypothetical protein
VLDDSRGSEEENSNKIGLGMHQFQGSARYNLYLELVLGIWLLDLSAQCSSTWVIISRSTGQSVFEEMSGRALNNL